MNHLKQLQDHINDFGFNIYYKVCDEFHELQNTLREITKHGLPPYYYDGSVLNNEGQKLYNKIQQLTKE